MPDAEVCNALNGLCCLPGFQSNKGVWVQATKEVSVYSVNKEPKSTDAYISLPVDVLGTEYYALTYTRDAELLVVGTEDNTQVSIKWPTNAGPVSVHYGGTTYGYVSNGEVVVVGVCCLLYTSPSPRDINSSRMPSSA